MLSKDQKCITLELGFKITAFYCIESFINCSWNVIKIHLLKGFPVFGTKIITKTEGMTSYGTLSIRFLFLLWEFSSTFFKKSHFT